MVIRKSFARITQLKVFLHHSSRVCWTNEKIPGTRNEYHIVKQKDYLLSDGVHEAIISEEMWDQAHRKRQETGVLQVKTHSLEHEHILSGIIKCPVCGSGMYGNVNRKKHPDGGYYKDYFYYACKHRKLVDGTPLYL